MRTNTVMNRLIGLNVMLAWTSLVAAQTPPFVSEKDFLTDMPIVLSVSRLPQRLDDTPGAVSIIDREMIRLSGARDVADLLRLVPGFQISTSFETSAPLVSYHGGFDAYSNRIQLLIDGRSAYSPYFIGSVGPGLQTVALADIERIEVLRGSNSAAYGARAVLGVINIVTRHTVDTLGLQGSLAVGANGIRDAQARIGWGSAGGSTFRLTLDRRADDGLTGSNGHNQVGRFNFRADVPLNASDEIQLRAGAVATNAGKGFAGYVDRLQRDTSLDTNYAQLDWRRSLGADADLVFALSHTQDAYRDSFPYSLLPLGINDSIEVQGSGRSSNDIVSLQHTFRHGPALRVVWGGEFRREQVTSRPLYNTDTAFVTEFTRLFGNAEWWLARDWVFNAGAMLEHSSMSGDSLAPRLMLNWHLADGQTVRAGVSRGFRPPSAYEQFADVRYAWNGHLLAVTTLASGKVGPENVLARELGYLGYFPKLQLNLDVRVFHEQISGFITQLKDTRPKDYANTDNFSIQGLEYQLKWRLWHGARLTFNQAYINMDAQDPATALAAPKIASTLALFQKLPGGLDLSLMHYEGGVATLHGSSPNIYMNRTDLRLGWPLRFGARKGELALVVQNLGQPYQDFDPAFTFQRRAFMTLQVEN